MKITEARVAVILPTRGLVFTKVEEALEEYRLGEYREDYNMRIFRSHDLPIPDGHNSLTRQALTDNFDYLWFVEEDTVPQAGALESLIQAKSSISCIDYGVTGWGCVTRNGRGEILWCGLGCTLVKREVFEALEYPYFRVDKTLRLNDWTWQDLPEEYIRTKQYGSLDIWFCMQARAKGFEIVQVEGECEHLKLDELGKVGVNNGLHQISIKEKITRKQIL